MTSTCISSVDHETTKLTATWKKEFHWFCRLAMQLLTLSSILYPPPSHA
jgi:hypothetical protein